jgi:DNA-binding response OmpR family regulator
MKILIIEDSERLLRSLGHGLKSLGYTVDLVPDGREGYDFARFGDHDVIILDLMLPGMDGLDILKNLRAIGKETHILILSARDRVEDRVKGLQLGADDYLVKPFAFDELVARIGSLVRRQYESKSPEIQLGEVVINSAKREATRNGKPVALTRSEYAILEYLVLNRGRVRTKDQILEVIHEDDAGGESNVIEVLICTLRKKIGPNGDGPIIKTRRGYGYLVE